VDPEILSTIADWDRRGIDFVLATVVGVRGSTYRGLAARQLVAADGTMVGTVSGGCLDNELALIAAGMDRKAPPKLVEFDLTADDEAVWGWGIGCNGITELLVESSSAATELAGDMRVDAPAMIHTLSGPGFGHHQRIDESDPDWGEELADALRDGRHRRVHRDGVDYLLELTSPPPQLVVCGAGHDAVPLVRLGKELGYDVTVVDDRRAFLTRERFPEADRLVQCAPAELSDRIAVDDRTAFVVMSHNYQRDVDFLGSLLGKGAAYIGCLGPGERLERMLKDLSARGQLPDPDDRIYGPAGLDLGADGPTEIAWSILAEIMSVRRRRKGGPLVEKKGPSGWRPLP
jgi:xanthine dehydrogenase accessory factor